MAGDSIALLQERFRQLQKDKQRRKEKELLRKLSDSEKIPAKMQFEQRKESFRSDFKLTQHRTVEEDSLCLSLNNRKQQDDQAHRQAMEMLGRWNNLERGDSSAKNSSSSEVDTTLHL